MSKRFFLLLLSGLLLFACTTTRRLNIQNIQFVYDRQYQYVFPEYKVFHLNDSISELFVRFNAADLLYIRKQGENSHKAHYRVNWRLYSDFDSSVLIDSASVKFTDSLYFEKDVSLVERIDIRFAKPGNYLLLLEFWDLNRKNVVSEFIPIDRESAYSIENFMFFVSDSILLFNTWIPGGQLVDVIFNKEENFVMQAEHYSQSFALPPPPFVVDVNTKPAFQVDTVLEVRFIKGKAKIDFAPEGFYYFHSQAERKGGFTLHRYQNAFPYVAQAEDLLGPLRYITTSAEFESLSKSADVKRAIDEFWVRIAGNPARAKELISRFYNRVQEANVYYTSYKPGWMTDRGMVYIAMGPPHAVYRSNNVETWKYYESRENMAATFRFERRSLIFSHKDFELIRSMHYKNAWYLAVDNWRR